jgi:hypothetical protein
MTVPRCIEVPLPAGMQPTPEDHEMLVALLGALLELRGSAPHWRETARALEADGWQVACHHGWIAEARRGRESERAYGSTREEAVAELLTLVQLDTPAAVS